MHLKMSSGKWRPFCLGLNVLTGLLRDNHKRDMRPSVVYHESASQTGGNDEQLYMMTSSNGNIFRVTGHLCGEFTGPWWIPRTKASDEELWCFLWSASHKRLSKQSPGWWFETPSRPLWRHCNELAYLLKREFQKSLIPCRASMLHHHYMEILRLKPPENSHHACPLLCSRVNLHSHHFAMISATLNAVKWRFITDLIMC